MPEFFGPLFRSAFLVNKKSLFLQKCQCIELLTVFRLHIYSILYSIYSIFSSKLTFKSWISTSEKRGPSCSNCPKENVSFSLKPSLSPKRPYYHFYPFPHTAYIAYTACTEKDEGTSQVWRCNNLVNCARLSNERDCIDPIC